MTQAEGGRDGGRERFRWPECTPGHPLTPTHSRFKRSVCVSVARVQCALPLAGSRCLVAPQTVLIKAYAKERLGKPLGRLGNT